MESKNSAQVDPRRVDQTGQRHGVLCRPPTLIAMILDPPQFRQGKYEEKKKEKVSKESGRAKGFK